MFQRILFRFEQAYHFTCRLVADLVIGLLLAVITLDTLDRFYAVLLEQHYAVLSLTFGAFGTGHKAFLDPVHLLSLVDKQ